MKGTILVLLSLLALLPLACGSDGNSSPDRNEQGRITAGPRLSAEEYFDQLGTAFDRLEQAVAASARPPAQISDPGQILQVIQQAMTGLQDAISPFVADVRSLTPPDQLAPAHREFVAALEKDQSEIVKLAERVRDADNLGEAQAAFESRQNALVESRVPCETLEELALAEGIAADLPCQE